MTVVAKSEQKKNANKVARVELNSRLSEVRKTWTRGECKARQEIALSLQNQLLRRLANQQNWPR